MKNNRFIAAAAVVAAGLISIGGAATASAAPAASGFDRCGAGNFCLFEHVDGQGRVTGHKAEKRTLPLDFDNITSSIRNRTGQVWSVYTEANFKGRCLPIAAIWTGNVTQYDMSDKISSIRPGGC
ncbi:peptidase inhibitor family I36 protein [Lentzea sp. NPDC092896]|uniref:peptidase inhibitor family I36 protein n=1 Tax=Lentzea sp. NPDC092896 TaxID=3364127 RepID=UPI003817AD1F